MASTAWLEWCEQKSDPSSRSRAKRIAALVAHGHPFAFHVACRCRVPVYLDFILMMMCPVLLFAGVNLQPRKTFNRATTDQPPG